MKQKSTRYKVDIFSSSIDFLPLGVNKQRLLNGETNLKRKNINFFYDDNLMSHENTWKELARSVSR